MGNSTTKVNAPKREPILPMRAALSQCEGDGSLKSAAHYFLTCDLSKLRTSNQFRKAFNGLAAAQQILGPVDGFYRKALRDMQETLTLMMKSFAIEDEVLAQWITLWDRAMDQVADAVNRGEWKVREEGLRKMFEEDQS